MNLAERLERTQFDLFWVPPIVRVFDRGGVLAISSKRPMPQLNQGVRVDVSVAGWRQTLREACAAFAPGLGRWFVPDPDDRPELVSALRSERFEGGHAFEARVLQTDRELAAGPTEVVRVSTLEGLRDVMSVGRRAFMVPLSFTDNELQKQLELGVGPHARARRYLIYEHGEPVCAGGMNVYPELSMGLLWAGGTVPEARGRGHYRALLAARLADARSLGLAWVGLYARVDTSAPVVAKHGFERVGDMVIYAAPEFADPT